MKKILIVDDSGLARRLVRKMLEELEYDVEEAASGPEALEAYALNQHDLVILDLLMTGMYGLEVLHKFKELNPSLPVIIATADIQRTTREQVKNAGACALINKPINKDELVELIERADKGEMSWN